jgi:Tat protein secretion system quality control protein TatD with DNase activity
MYNDDIEAKLLQAASHPKCVAWGEMGLDYNDRVKGVNNLISDLIETFPSFSVCRLRQNSIYTTVSSLHIPSAVS